MDSTEPAEKTCLGCGATLLIGTFAPIGNRPGKRLPRCGPCQKQREAAYREAHRSQLRANWRAYKERHPERVLEQARKTREKYPERRHEAQKKCRAKRPEYYAEKQREYCRANPEKKRLWTKQSAARHPDRIKERRRRYFQEHRAELVELHKPIFHRYRARKMGNGGSFTADQWQALKARYNWTCLACGKREPDIKLQADHVVPLALGGWNIISNIQCLCGSCNGRKRDRFIEYRPDFL